MSGPLSQKTHKQQNKYIFLSCAECDRATRHEIIAETKSHWQDDSGVVDLWTEHQIVQCQGCMSISFSEASQFSEDWDVDQDTGETIIPKKCTLYPERISGRNEMSDSYLLPDLVNKIYEETRKSLNSNLKVMTGFGIRAIVEAVCNDKKITGKNLQAKIDGLIKDGHITPEGGKILQSLRFMGNESAHEIKEHATKELDAAFDVVEYLLKGVYVIPELASKLPKRS